MKERVHGWYFLQFVINSCLSSWRHKQIMSRFFPPYILFVMTVHFYKVQHYRAFFGEGSFKCECFSWRAWSRNDLSKGNPNSQDTCVCARLRLTRDATGRKRYRKWMILFEAFYCRTRVTCDPSDKYTKHSSFFNRENSHRLVTLWERTQRLSCETRHCRYQKPWGSGGRKFCRFAERSGHFLCYYAHFLPWRRWGGMSSTFFLLD